MKYIFCLLVISISCVLNAQPVYSFSYSSKQRKAAIDSIVSTSIPYLQMKSSYNAERGKWSYLTTLVDSLILTNGARAKFQTSDNAKVKVLLEKIFSLNPIDFLLDLRGIEGWISVEVTRIDWVKKEHISDLIRVTSSNIITPELQQGESEWEKRNRRNDGHPLLKPTYFKTPLGINALNLIDTYLDGLFPSVTPSFESVKTWYDSGKPKDEYEFELFTPITGYRKPIPASPRNSL